MKRSLIIVVAILILLVLAGCIRPQEQEELIIEEFPENEIQFELGSISGLRSSYEIVVKGELLATVHAWIEDDATLFLRFEASDGWLLLESRAATSTTLTGMPKNEDGKTDPSLFSGEVHITPLKEYTLSLPLGKLSDGQKVYFGTYSEFRKVGTRTRVKYGVCINSFIYHDDTPVIDKKPKLEGDIDDPLVRGFTYDWEIEKSVDPESVELKLGESAALSYTINATRTPADGSFSLSGAVNLNSTGELPASNISITVILQYLLGDVYTDLEGFTAINVDTSATPTLNPGESSSYKYDFTFDPKEGVDEYRIRASITADDLFPFTLNATFTLSGLAESTDATATIADQLRDIESEIPGGFSAAYVPPTTGSWVLEKLGDGIQTFSLVYEVLLTNEKIEDPQQDFYILDNTATLTEYDSKTEHSDDARVIITVPQPFIDNPDLKIENEHEMEWDQEKAYSWEIEKSATPESIELEEGEDGTFTYTLLATRTVEETNIATLTGLATVTNTGNVDLTNIAVEIILEDAARVEIDKYTTTIAALAVGAQEGLPYSFTFDPTGYTAPFKVIAKATAGTASDEVQTEQLLPTPNLTEIDEDAYVEDTFDPFSVTGIAIEGNIDRDWLNIIEGSDWNSLTSSWSVSYTVVATNTGAAPGEYPLDNTVVIYGEDTEDEYDRDDEEVKIIVPEDSDLKIENEHDMEWDQEKAYSWEIEKSATPESIELEEGEDGTFTYTLLATRTVEETNIATLTGLATVTNTGNVDLTNIAVEIILEDADGVEIDKYTTTIAALAVGAQEGLPYSFTFDPTVYTAPFKVIAKATAGTASDEVQTEQLLPTPNLTEIDEDAYVEDTFDPFSVTGIAIEGNIDRDWLNIIEGSDWNSLTSSWSVSYTVVATNTGAAPGEYPLDNTVVIYGEDTEDEYDRDDEEVKIIVPEDSDLKIENEHEMEWDQEKAYSWEIEKSATPESIELEEGEDGTFTYTLLATRTVEETNIATLTGLATVTNTGNVDLTNIAVEIILEDADGVEIDKYTTTIAALAVGAQEGLPYSFTFDPTGYTAPFKVIAKATAGTASDEVQTEQLLPTPNLTEIDEDAYVEDTFDPFSVTGIAIEGNIDRDWLNIIEGSDWNSLTSSWSVSYTVVATNTGAAPGEYPLDNTVVIYGEDTEDEYDRDDEEVKIIVPEDSDLKIENEHDMEWDQEKAYSWEIEKSATPESIELEEGEDGTFTYTLLATRTVKETNIATLTGLATVTNTGNVDLTNIAVEIILEDADGVEIDKYTTTIAALAVGAQEGLPYSFTFDPTVYTAPFKVIAKATAGTASDEVQTEQLLPTPNVTEIDKDAYVEDTFDPFSVTGIAIEGNIDRDWLNIIEGSDWNSLTSSWSVSYTVVATNTGAAPGEYQLHNTVVIYGEDTRLEHDRDDEKVKILVSKIEPGDFRTQTMGGWGTAASGNNPGTYRDANFASAFPNGLLVGSLSGYSALFDSSLAIQNFLPAGGPSGSFNKSYTNPTSTNAGTLAGQAVALTLSIGFDLHDPDFGASSYNLKDLLVVSGDFLGWTVEEVLAEANRFLAGLGSAYSATQLNEVLNSINENFVDGNTNKGFLRLP